MINFITYTVLVLNVTAVLLYPLIIGQERKPYSYGGFITQVMEMVLIAVICGRVLNWW